MRTNNPTANKLGVTLATSAHNNNRRRMPHELLSLRKPATNQPVGRCQHDSSLETHGAPISPLHEVTSHRSGRHKHLREHQPLCASSLQQTVSGTLPNITAEELPAWQPDLHE